MISNCWTKYRLADICEINPKKKEISELNAETEVSFLPMSSVSVEGNMAPREIRKLRDVLKGYTYFRDSDVLLAKITPCFENGKRAIAKDLKNKIGFGSTEFHVLRPSENVTSKWIFYAISRDDFRNIAKSQMTGTAGQKRVPSRVLEKFEIPVPDKSIQDTITDYIETQFTRLDASVKVLQSVKKKLVLYRKCVLKAAFEGKLVYIDDFKISTIDGVAKVKGGKRIPKGYLIQESRTAYPYLRVCDFSGFSVNLSDLKYITNEIYEKISRYTISANDVYISIAGTIGRVGMIQPELDGANLTENAAKITEINGIIPKYIMYYLASPKARELISFSTKSTSQPKLALFRIGNLNISFPESVEKQHQIVSEIESRFSVIDKIEETVDHALDKAEKLRKSILKSAFEGKLIKEGECK